VQAAVTVIGRQIPGDHSQRINLAGADLTGADLARADLADADLTDALLSKNMRVPQGWVRDSDSGRLSRANPDADHSVS
jgi:uncharacterized protein YjbI with pentapeptide repeats